MKTFIQVWKAIPWCILLFGHNWMHYRVTRKIHISDRPEFTKFTFRVRECTMCGKTQCSTKPNNTLFIEWDDYEHSEEVMILKNIKE